MKKFNKKINLDEKDIPYEYLNVSYYLNKYLKKLPDPPLHPKTKKPIGPDDLLSIFPLELIKQEASLAKSIPIPEKVREAYRLYRPTPLIRATQLEKVLGTPAHIYYKYEGVSPVGSHKLNTALTQAYFNAQEGVKKLFTETGAGQWGSALAFACKIFGLECEVYMVRSSFFQKPYRRILMETFGAKVFPSPSTNTSFGKKLLAKDPNHKGSLGIAVTEAIVRTAETSNSKYSLGSVLNHVLLHQTIIGLEAKKQMEKVDEYPDVIIGCVGGGSNFAGIAFPFMADRLSKKRRLDFLAVEPDACPSLTKGKYIYDYGDNVGLTPLIKMYSLGHDFVPEAIHAGGLRYHGMSPLISLLVHEGLIKAKSYPQNKIFEAAVTFAQTEGIIPAPESAHAIKAVIDEALQCRKEGKRKTILFCLSGHGLLDLSAYDSFFQGKII